MPKDKFACLKCGKLYDRYDVAEACETSHALGKDARQVWGGEVKSVAFKSFSLAALMREAASYFEKEMVKDPAFHISRYPSGAYYLIIYGDAAKEEQRPFNSRITEV